MKKVLIVFALVLISSFSFQIVKADTLPTYNAAVTIADNTNDKIDRLVLKAQQEALVSPDLVDQIVADLIAQTELISTKAIDVIDNLGFDAECYTVVVNIGGVSVTIDPIRVHTW